MNDEKEIKEEKKESKTSKRNWLIAAIVIILLVSIFAYFLDRNNNAKIAELSKKNKLNVINLKSLTDNVITINETNSKGDLTFTTNKDGTVAARTKHLSNDIPIGFAITGKVNDVDYLTSIEDYNWTWEKLDYNVIRRRVNITRFEIALKRNPDLNITEDLIDNITFVLTNLTGTNNNSQLTWQTQWKFDPERSPKLKHTITNNLGRDIANITYWFVFKLPEDFKIKFGETSFINVTKTKDTRIINTRTANLTSVVPIIDLGEIEFIYADLLKNNFTISDFYTGNGSLVGHPETLIGAIGITKENSVLRNKETIILDPEVTNWKSPTRTGQFYNAWAIGDNIKTSNDAWTTSATAHQLLGTDLYGFDSIPANAVITGIEIKVEANIDTICP